MTDNVYKKLMHDLELVDDIVKEMTGGEHNGKEN